MLRTSPKPGTPVAWLIGNQADGRTDIYPGIVTEGEHPGVDDRGVPGQIITLIVQRTNLQGEKYLRVQNIRGHRFLLPRNDRVMELDGAEDAPMTLGDLLDKVNADLVNFVQNRGATDFVAAADGDTSA